MTHRQKILYCLSKKVSNYYKPSLPGRAKLSVSLGISFSVPRWGVDGRSGKVLIQNDAIGSELVDVGGTDGIVSVKTDVSRTQIVRHQNDNVRTAAFKPDGGQKSTRIKRKSSAFSIIYFSMINAMIHELANVLFFSVSPTRFLCPNAPEVPKSQSFRGNSSGALSFIVCPAFSFSASTRMSPDLVTQLATPDFYI